MPIKRRQGENKEEFISRCIPIEITNGKSGEQAAAICYSYWEEKQLTAVKNIRKKKLNFESYTDYPKAAIENAKIALRWAEENGWGDCATPVGKMRANQLAKGEPISEETIARMAAFERHRQNSQKELGDGCGRIAWLSWGGDEGIEWAQRKLKEIRGEKLSGDKGLDVIKNIRKKNYKELQLLNMNIFGYRPKNFDMCPGAVSLFEHLMSMNSDEDVKGMIRSAAQIADNIFGIEKKVIGDNKAMIADVYEAEILLDDFEDLMEEIDVLLGMEHDVDFMEGHLEIIEGYLKNDVLEFKKVRAFVQSSNVDKVMYDDIETRLVVQFMDGSIYTYVGVTQNQFDNIVDGNAAPITTDSRKPPRWKMGEGPSVGAALYKWLTKRDKGTKGGSFR